MTRRMAQTVRTPVARRAPTARSWALIQARSENSGAKAARMATISGGRSTGVGLRERWLVCHHRSWPTSPWICQPTLPKSSFTDRRVSHALRDGSFLRRSGLARDPPQVAQDFGVDDRRHGAERDEAGVVFAPGLIVGVAAHVDGAE